MPTLSPVEVPVIPDMSGFLSKINTEIRAIPDARLRLDSAEATAKVQGVKEQVASIGRNSTKVNLDGSEAAAKIAAIKAQIMSIQQERLKVNVDTAEAAAKIAALRVQEKSLKDDIRAFQGGQGNNSVPIDSGRQLADVQAQISALQTNRGAVRVDTAEAIAKVAALRAQIDTIRDEHVNVKVDDNGSAARTKSEISGIGSSLDIIPAKVALIGAGLIALIPIAAAASGALAGIGAGIGLGAVGAGIGALALGPVFKALSAQKSAGGGGTPGQSQALQVAQALNTQRQAEIGLTTAQRNAVDAQKALTQARIDAAQALQDLSDKVIDNGLAQRQATLDLAKAKQDLDIAKANPDVANAANANALSQVQLVYDEASQNLAELQTQGARLATQRAAANAAGVDGAQNVVTAQQQIVDSQNALVQAQFEVAQSAGKVAESQAAAAGASSAYATALAKLNPAQRQFLEFLQGIKGQLSIISGSASSGLLPKLQVAIQDLLPLVPPFAGFIGHLASAFGDLAIHAAEGLNNPFWTQFGQFLDKASGPAVGLFGSILGDLATIAAAAFQAFWPAIDATGRSLDGFLKHIAGSIQGGSLDGFTNYVKDNLPRVGKFFEALGRAIGHVVSALAPLGGGLLDGLTHVLDGISKLPPGLIQGGAVGVGAAAVGGKVASAAAPLVGFAVANPEVAAGIAAAAALAVGFTLLYTKSKTFHDFINDKLLPVLKRIGEDALEGVRRGFDFVSDAIDRNKPQLTELLHAFEKIGDFILTKVVPILGPILKLAFEAIGFSIGLTIDAIGWLVDAFNWIVDAGKSTYNWIVDTWGKVSSFFSTAVDGVVGFFEKLPGRILDAIGDVAGWLFQKGVDLIQGIIDGIGSMAGKIAKAIADQIPGGSFLFSNSGTDSSFRDIAWKLKDAGQSVPPEWQRYLDHRATGGPVMPGQMYGVNEQGIEAFMPLVPGFITTASDTQRMVKSLAALANGQGAGTGRQVTQYFQLPMTDPVAIAAATNRRLTRV